MSLPVPVGATVRGVRSASGNAVVHVAAEASSVVATYPVANETVSFAADQHDLWRVDFDGVLHHTVV